MKSILVTGGNGFLGEALLNRLAEYEVVALGRRRPNLLGEGRFVEGEIGVSNSYGSELENVDVVVHCAARVHVMNEPSLDPLSEFRLVNTQGTLNLAKQAAQAGTKRFIFISSIKVNGEFTEAGHPFKPEDGFIPTDPYGLSKYEAEVGLRKIAEDTGMEVVIIRPPLVYGPGVKGNFASMMRWLAKGVPLPLGAIHNQRSLVALDNLVDFIVSCIEHSNAANETFLVSDDEDISTTLLLTKLGMGLGVSNRLLAVPGQWIEFAAKLMGKKDVAQRILGSLQVDITKTKERLNWAPPYTVDESLKKTTQSYLKHKQV